MLDFTASRRRNTFLLQISGDAPFAVALVGVAVALTSATATPFSNAAAWTRHGSATNTVLSPSRRARELSRLHLVNPTFNTRCTYGSPRAETQRCTKRSHRQTDEPSCSCTRRTFRPVGDLETSCRISRGQRLQRCRSRATPARVLCHASPTAVSRRRDSDPTSTTQERRCARRLQANYPNKNEKAARSPRPAPPLWCRNTAGITSSRRPAPCPRRKYVHNFRR